MGGRGGNEGLRAMSEKKPNILILTQWFGIPGFWLLVRDLAKHLEKNGYHVEVLTAVPYRLTTGKICDGYKIRFRQTEWEDGIKIVRLPLYINQSKSGLRRMLCYGSFRLSAATIGQFGLTRPDIVFCYNLPTLGRAARLFRFFRGAKLVYMIEDLWPESVTESGMMAKSRLLTSILSKWSDRFYRSADALTVLSPGFKRNLVARGVPEEKIEVVYNWTDERNEPPKRKIRRDGDPFVVAFAGNLGVMQGLDVVIDAATLAREKGIPVQFRLIGEGVESARLKKVVSERNLTNVEFTGRIPSSEVNNTLSDADALLVHLKRLDLFKITIPSKTQSYLFAGKPILCGLEGDAADLIQKADAGIRFEPTDSAGLLEAVERMIHLPPEELERMGASGRSFYDAHLSLNAGCQRIETLFDRLLGEKSR